MAREPLRLATGPLHIVRTFGNDTIWVGLGNATNKKHAQIPPRDFTNHAYTLWLETAEDHSYRIGRGMIFFKDGCVGVKATASSHNINTAIAALQGTLVDVMIDA